MSNNLKVFGSPEKYVQGSDATAFIGEEMKKLGLKSPVVVVSSQTPYKLLHEKWEKSLEANGYDFTYLPFGGICTSKEADKIAQVAKNADAKTLIAFGGGQVIDAVRSASVLSDCEFVSCPSIASTDAPCSTLCVMYHEDHSFQEYRFTKRHPTLVLVDTRVVALAPRRMLVGGIGDALATWFEARSVREANAKNFLGGKQTETGLALSKLCYETLMNDGVAAARDVEVDAITPALERVVEANTLLSGLGFESGGLCIAHAVHNGLTTQPQCANYTHGEKVAFGLVTQLVLEGRPQEELKRVLKFCYDVQLPITLKAVGIDSTDTNAIRQIAERATVEGETSHNGLFPVNAEILADAIRAADYCGQNFEKNHAREQCNPQAV
ncbi:glycerol dehydrogenase [Chaetoceros tenuissimus]|uniref:Glycerol dehydrogenase n=1 Tax=Chaetoceros tenuissimus TaxID=426638 RepID=A0AAD3CH80_9STRA|nr:glycerol dehydrogenase [Chaetoceros tenuissimus]